MQVNSSVRRCLRNEEQQWRRGKTRLDPRALCSQQSQTGESAGGKQGKVLFSTAMARKINLLKGGERENFGVATGKTPLQPSGLCQADRGELGREGSDPVVPTLRRDNAQFPAVSASDNPIIPSLFFQSLFEPVTHYKQNVFVLFLTAKL